MIRPAGAHTAEISDESGMPNDTPSAIVSKATIVTVPSVHNACGNGATEDEGVRGYVESSAVPLTLRYVSDGC